MSLRDDVQMYARFAREMRALLKGNLSKEQARAIILERMAQRDDNFLRLVERTVYGHPSSPYLALLQHAHCEWNDLRAA